MKLDQRGGIDTMWTCGVPTVPGISTVSAVHRVPYTRSNLGKVLAKQCQGYGIDSNGPKWKVQC